MKKQKMF